MKNNKKALILLMMVMIVAIGSTKYSYVSPLLKLSPIATKGLSLIATDHIKKGTLLIEEEALFQLKTFNIRMTEDVEIDRITKKIECLSSKENDGTTRVFKINTNK